MNTEFNLNTVSFADPSGSDPFRPRSVLVSLLQLLSKGFREIWAGYVRSLDRAAGLPPQI